MPSHDIPNDRYPDPEESNIPANIVAHCASDGRTIIYDEREGAAWISSTYAISLQNLP